MARLHSRTPVACTSAKARSLKASATGEGNRTNDRLMEKFRSPDAFPLALFSNPSKHFSMKSDVSGFDSSPWQTRFLGIYTDHLPHWVVECGRYAVTIRCAGKLPVGVQARLEEVRRTLLTIPPRSEAAEEQRRSLFRILEAEIDHGRGFAPFRDQVLSEAFLSWLGDYDSDGLRLTDYVLMPNHIHLITDALRVEEAEQFRHIWSNFKGRSARWLNHHLGRTGAFWQRFWYDRWIRGPEELAKWQRYLKANPIKAGLVQEGGEYPYLRIRK